MGRVKSSVKARCFLLGFSCIFLWILGCPDPTGVLRIINNAKQVATPIFEPTAGTYSIDTNVRIKCATDEATIHYTTDGSLPTASSNVYDSNNLVLVAGNGTKKTIKAYATKAGMNDSAIASASYEINWNVVSTPQFNPVAGTYNSDQAVTISSTTDGATIYYTTDGTEPSTSSQVFSSVSPISVVGDQNGSKDTTIKALGHKAGMTDSPASATYTISYPQVSLPQLSPAGGVYEIPQLVTITDTTAGATIYYTTDGNTPTTSSTVYNNTPIAISNIGTKTTVKAIAAKSKMTTSSVASGSFEIYQFAKGAGTTVSAPSTNCYSSFNGVTHDSSGNIYACGSLNFEVTGEFSFGNGVKVSRSTSGNQPSAILLKYDSSGVPQWVQSVNDGSADYNSVAIDASANLYAAGDILGTSTYTFGSGVSAQGTSGAGNVVLVKYDSSGTALWARTFTSGSVSGNCYYWSVAVNSAGDIVVAGDIGYSGILGFGNGVSVTADSTHKRPILVKYDGLPRPMWARTVSSSAASDGRFCALAEDSSLNIYVAGYMPAGTYDFGFGVTAVGTAGTNGVIVKYTSAGTPVWARVKPGSFRAVSVDSLGNVCVAGAGDVTLAKYDASGNLLWSSAEGSYFGGIALDATGNIYAAGNLNVGTSTTTFGNNVFATGAYSGFNAILVKYNSGGAAQWAQTAITGPNYSTFSATTVDSLGNISAVGSIYGGSTFDFGNGVRVAGQSAMNPVLVRY